MLSETWDRLIDLLKAYCGADFRDKLWGPKEELQTTHCPVQQEHPPTSTSDMTVHVPTFDLRKRRRLIYGPLHITQLLLSVIDIV